MLSYLGDSLSVIDVSSERLGTLKPFFRCELSSVCGANISGTESDREYHSSLGVRSGAKRPARTDPTCLFWVTKGQFR